MSADTLFQRCILCGDALEYEDLKLALTDSDLGPGQIHKDCYNQLIYAKAQMKGAGYKECRRIQR